MSMQWKKKSNKQNSWQEWHSTTSSKHLNKRKTWKRSFFTVIIKPMKNWKTTANKI